MSRFWKMRLLTLAWGFGTSWWFTGELVTSMKMWAVVVAGNTLIMWIFSK